MSYNKKLKISPKNKVKASLPVRRRPRPNLARHCPPGARLRRPGDNRSSPPPGGALPGRPAPAATPAHCPPHGRALLLRGVTPLLPRSAKLLLPEATQRPCDSAHPGATPLLLAARMAPTHGRLLLVAATQGGDGGDDAAAGAALGLVAPVLV